jgi:bifunctional non-homologous end joining protein LigD
MSTDKPSAYRSKREPGTTPRKPPAALHRPVPLNPGKLEGAKAAPLPRAIAPQLATQADEPPRGTGWVHEIKFDGYRTLALLRDGQCRLITRSGLDWTDRYGGLRHVFEELQCEEAAIDGEICVPDENGVTTFEALQHALSANDGHKLVFYAFDIIHLDGYDLRRGPLVKRKALLQRLAGTEASPPPGIVVSDHVEGDGRDLYEKVSELGLEGIVSKRADAVYVEGRTKTWVKVKAKKAAEYVIAGYTPSEVAGGLGALGMAEWVDGELVWRGRVGTGFNQATIRMLLKRLKPLEDGGVKLEGFGTKDMIWVRPVLAAAIRYSNLTSDGIMRHAVYHGLREPEVAAERSAAMPSRKRLITDADFAGLVVTNPTRRMFGKSGPTKLDIAVYYAAVGDYMLPHIMGRPVSLVRCPNAKAEDCFFQRHAFNGMPKTLATFPVEVSDGVRNYLSVEDAKGYLALAQLGIVEFHAWGSMKSDIERPDRITFDLDPGEGLHFREVVEAALHVRDVLRKHLKLVPFVKTTGGKGLHLVVPIKPKLQWKEVHAITSQIASAIAGADPGTFTTTMGQSNRKRRIFIDIHRNARTATAVSAYSLRARPNLPASAPVSWADLPSIDAPSDFNYAVLPSFLTKTGDPWADINQSARDLAPLSKART